MSEGKFQANPVADNKVEFSGFDAKAAKIWWCQYDNEAARNDTGKANSNAQDLQGGKLAVPDTTFVGTDHWVIKSYDGDGNHIDDDNQFYPDPHNGAQLRIPAPSGWTAIKYIFVLMMENRSFDHMLGAMGLTDNRIDGVQNVPADQKQYVNPVPPDPFLVDPGHEFDHVHGQLYGTPTSRKDATINANDPGTPTMNGFMDVYKTRLKDTANDSQVTVR